MKGKGGGEPAGWKSQITDLPGVTMVAGATIDGVLVETVGKVTPEEIKASYVKTFAAAKAFATQKGITIDDPKVTQIVAVPAELFCDVRTYTKEVPEDCVHALGAARFTDSGAHRLSVIADPERLQNGMVAAVANGVCYFAPIDAKVDEICAVMSEFKDAQLGGAKDGNKAPR